MSAEPVFEPDRVVAALNAAGVEYVIVGGLAMGAHGVVRATRDVDIVAAPDRRNMDRLAECLRTLGGEHPIEGPLTGTALVRPASFKVQTKHGEVQVLSWQNCTAPPDYFPSFSRERPGGAVCESCLRRSSCSQWWAMRCLPALVSPTRVFGFLPTKRFLIWTSPASSSFVRWLERLPLVRPVARWRNTKSASLREDSTVRIASRPGSCTSRSKVGSSLCSSTAVLQRGDLRRPEGADEQAVVEGAAGHQRDARHHDTDVARVVARPERHGAREQERAPYRHSHPNEHRQAAAQLLAGGRAKPPVALVVVARDAEARRAGEPDARDEDPRGCERTGLPIVEGSQGEQRAERKKKQPPQIRVLGCGGFEILAFHWLLSRSD